MYECSWCADDHEHPPEIESGGVELCVSCAQDAVRCARCNDVKNYDDAYTLGDESYCETCFDELASQCDYCDDYERADDLLYYDNITLCEYCRSSYFTVCNSCGDAVHDDRINCDDYHCYCDYCHEDRKPENTRNITARVIAGASRPGGFGFGVEIETEFPNGHPFDLGDYHSEWPAEPRYFFGGWRAEEDGSLDNGGEFVSPPLDGAGGLGEILITAQTLKDNGAAMKRSCGAHITVECVPQRHDRTERETQIAVQRLTLALEEALLATTGSYHRLNHHYCSRIKRNGAQSVREKKQVYGRTLALGIKPAGLVEFRYPPGTLDPAQIALNVGLAQLIVGLAASLDDDEIDALVEKSLEIEMEDADEKMKVHRQIIMGLQFLARHGWHAGGEMAGLPYDPHNVPATVEVMDHERGHHNTVRLPSGKEIAARMERQVGRFYNKMGMGFTFASMEAIEIIATEERANV